jgi:FkbH-like protein
LRLTDRFGDYGLVSVILAVPEPEGRPNTLEIDTWLMSCRVISRTVEEFFFNWLVDQCRRRGANTLIGSYSPTPKNALVEGLYPRLGFSRRSARPDGAIVYDLDVKAAAPARTFVQVKDLVVQGVVA